MKSRNIKRNKISVQSKLISDYLDDEKKLKDFHSGVPSIKKLYQQALQKKSSYPLEVRLSLHNVLNSQYEGIKLSPKTKKNLKIIKNESTLTVSTGHQLCLMTGPLYFIYKIISTIKLTQELNKKYPDLDFVPIYWMASEDHDFEEISDFVFNGKNLNGIIHQKGRLVKFQHNL